MNIAFDEQARVEFLTGFHKRKLARTEAARKRAVERQKQERLLARREKRRLLRERAAENVALVEKAYGVQRDDDHVDDDIEVRTGMSPSNLNNDTEQFENEEQLTTVTIVEDFDPDVLIHGPPKPKLDPLHQSSDDHFSPARMQTHAKPSHTSNNSRSKKVRYQTSSARKAERSKQRTRKKEKADLARGKKRRSRTQ